ncbi:MAG: YceI family protein [Burkholderiaceae bacterium]
MKTVFLFAPLLMALAPAFATDYTQIQANKSSIAFSYKQMGVGMTGKFKKFSGQLSFNPEQAAKAKTSFDVDLGSIDTGSPEANDEVGGKAWFSTKLFPVAHFASGSVKAIGGNRYEVAGKLTIKGKTQEVIVPATFSSQGKEGVFDGSFTIRRGDFSIGEGEWAKFDIVANDINVKFRFTATSGK